MRPTQPLILFYFALTAMELSYLYILASLLSGPTYALILMLSLYPFALLSKLALSHSAFSHRLRVALEVALVTLVIVLVAREQMVSSLATGHTDVLGTILRMGFCGLAWLMGYTVPHEQFNYSTISFRLQMGIIAVLVFAQVMGSAPPVFLFFLLAPLALFLARWASSLSRGATTVHPPNPSHLLLAGAGVMMPAIALILLFSPDVARSIVSWLGNISTKLNDWLMSRHEAAATPPGEFKLPFGCDIRPEVVEMPPLEPVLPPPGDATGVSPVVIWIIVLVIFLAIAVFIAFALRRRRTGRKDQTAKPLQFQIRNVSLNMLRSLIYLFPRLLKKLWLWIILLVQRCKKRPKPSEETLISIRALYLSLLRWAARQGVARLPSQTPLEHLVLLEQGFPQQQDDLRQITGAYLLGRYSQQSVSQEEFDRARKACQRIVAHHTRPRVRG